MQTSPRSSPHWGSGVFHRWIESRNSTFPQLPYLPVSTAASAPLPEKSTRRSLVASHDSVLLPAAPYQTATSAWVSGCIVQSIHFSMQLGCGALAEIIQVSAQPVTPSEGTTASTGASSSARLRLNGHAPPTSIEPSTKPSISSV